MLRKRRYYIPFGDDDPHVLELDVFTNPPGLVLAEVEALEGETASDLKKLPLPKWLEKISYDVTNDPMHKNSQIFLNGVPDFDSDKID